MLRKISFIFIEMSTREETRSYSTQSKKRERIRNRISSLQTIKSIQKDIPTKQIGSYNLLFPKIKAVRN